ncbi:MAG: serine/threonine protein kinase [Elusimicrobia bacterium]|nr:serine/threonine protein kinase [Elusimicrobiota bacterium]
MVPLRSLAVILFLALPSAYGAEAPSGQHPAKRSGEIKKDLTNQMMELTPLLQKLEALKNAYKKGDPAAAMDDRFRIREDIVRRAATLFVGLQYFRQVRGSEEAQIFDYSEFDAEVSSFVRTADDMLADEAKAFKSARRAYRIWGWVKVAVFLLALLGLCVLLWRKREPAMRLIRGRMVEREEAPGAEEPSAPAAAAELAPGALLLGTYRIDKDLGKGGMGLVYGATDINLDRKVAIKIMREELTKSGMEPDMFLSEARMVASLKHPNIVEIHAVMKEGNQIFLVFEYVYGQPLSKVLSGGKRISMRSTKILLRQIAAALDFAHCRKIIHRDLKPSNIMITSEGSAKVMDFGIAHVAQVTAAAASRSDICGTPPYMAPEQELGVVSRESDIFSLGVVLYEMLTGRLPYAGPDFLVQKESMNYAPPSQVIQNIPRQADEIIRQALQFDPRLRYHTATEIVMALDAIP